MEICFKNDGSYDSSAVYAPILVGGCPIGFIQTVSDDTVTCLLWDRCVANQYLEDGRFANIYISIFGG